MNNYPDKVAGARPPELFTTTVAVSLFCQYIRSGVPANSRFHETCLSPLAVTFKAQVAPQTLLKWTSQLRKFL